MSRGSRRCADNTRGTRGLVRDLVPVTRQNTVMARFQRLEERALRARLQQELRHMLIPYTRTMTLTSMSLVFGIPRSQLSRALSDSPTGGPPTERRQAALDRLRNLAEAANSKEPKDTE